jgi:hypothetical protein
MGTAQCWDRVTGRLVVEDVALDVESSCAVAASRLRRGLLVSAGPFLMVLASCFSSIAQEKSSAVVTPSSELEIDASDVAQILAVVATEVLELPSGVPEQAVPLPVQVDGYVGALPATLVGRRVVATGDFLKAALEKPTSTSIYIRIEKEDVNQVRVHAAQSWGTGRLDGGAILRRDESGRWWMSTCLGKITQV